MSEMFDRLAKTVAGGVSRRDALKYLGGVLAGGFLAVLPGRARADDDKGGGDDNGDEINETCHAFCKKCPKKGGVFGHCIGQCKATLRKNPSGSPCGTCASITNTATDVKNCGGCGPKFACTGTKPACCSGTCADLASTTNCGACGNDCSKVITAALVGCCAGKCTDLTKPTSCGACTTQCSSSQTCQCTTSAAGVTTCTCVST